MSSSRLKKMDTKAMEEVLGQITGMKTLEKNVDLGKIKEILSTLHAFSLSLMNKMETLEVALGVSRRDEEVNAQRIQALERKLEAEKEKWKEEGIKWRKEVEEEWEKKEIMWNRAHKGMAHEIEALRKREGEQEGLTDQMERLREENKNLRQELKKLLETQGKQEEEVKGMTERLEEDQKENQKWIDVVKKGGGAPKKEIISDTIEEEKRRESKANNVVVRGLDVGTSPKEDAQILARKIGADLSFESAWRVGKDLTRERPLVIRFRSMETKAAFLAKRGALKGTKIYLDEDLTLLQVEQRRAGMVQVIAARREGKWAVFRDGRVIIRDRHSS